MSLNVEEIQDHLTTEPGLLGLAAFGGDVHRGRGTPRSGLTIPPPPDGVRKSEALAAIFQNLV